MKIRSGFVSNSSTSSFVCQERMSLKKVKNKLQQMVTMHNELMETNFNFKDVFEEPFIADEEFCNSEWGQYYDGIESAKGKLIIQGAYDNSIPYSMWQYIEEIFDAERFHLG